MEAMALALPVRMVGFHEVLRIRQRRTILTGYRIRNKGKAYVHLLAWNAFYSLAVKLIPDDLYDWQDDDLDLFLEEPIATYSI